MSTTPSVARAAALAIVLALAPASTLFAQSHKGHHSGKGGSGGQGMTKAAQPARAATAPARTMKPPQASTTKATNAHANQAGAGTHQNHSNANQARPSDAALVSSLQSTRTHLNQANHDYNGHRAQALRQVENAIRLLSAQAGHSRTGNATAGVARSSPAGGTTGGSAAASRSGAVAGSGSQGNSGTGQGISQATSDSHLREAQQALQTLESQMGTEGMNAHSFIQAKSAVQGAIRELNLALNDL